MDCGRFLGCCRRSCRLSNKVTIVDKKMHWESVYETKSPDSVSWYAPHLLQSLHYVTKAVPNKDAFIIDVGGGESTLVDDLLAAGYSNVTVNDLSSTALEVAKKRLGARAKDVTWKAADVLEMELPKEMFDVWHDRAVFHFLTTNAQRERYVAQVLHALKPGGFAIVGTFGPDGPDKCSGLPVARYAPTELHARFGEPFELIESNVEVHNTPWGTPQQFVYCFCRRQRC